MPDTSSVWPTLVWVLGLFGIWVLLSIPAYAVLSVWVQLRAAFANSVRLIGAFSSATAIRLEAATQRIRSELQLAVTWYEVDPTAQSAWTDSVVAITKDARANALHVEAAQATAARSLRVFQPIAKRLKRLKLTSEGVPAIPEVTVALDSARRSRAAITNLIAASILLPPIVIANAQMTGLVLSEVIPPVKPLLGLPVPLVVAAVLVVAEAAVGLLHSAEAESREGTERSFTLMTAVWTSAALVVIGIEAMLYGVVQPKNMVQIPVAGSVFGLVGALLGLSVVGLGWLLHHSLMTFRKERTPRAVRKELERLKYAAEEWNTLAERVLPHQNDAITAFERLAELCAESAAVQTHAIKKSYAELERHKLEFPDWARAGMRKLTTAEFQERESRTYLWLLIGAAAAFALVVIGGALRVRGGIPVGVAVGLGVALASFAVGIFSGQTAARHRNEKLWWHAGFALIVLAISVAAARFLRGAVTSHAVAVGIPAVATFLSGVQIGPNVALVRLPVRFVWRAIVGAVLGVVLTALWIVNVLTKLIEYVLAILAWPTMVTLNAMRSRARTPSHVPV